MNCVSLTFRQTIRLQTESSTSFVQLSLPEISGYATNKNDCGALDKSFLYGLLVFAFHIVEEIVKRLIQGQDIAGAFHRLDDLLARSIVIFCTLIPFFAFRELARVLGPEKLRALFFISGAALKSK
jgi:hypothetical protein